MHAEDASVLKTQHAKSGNQNDKSKIQEASWKKIAKPTDAASSIEPACSLEAAVGCRSQRFVSVWKRAAGIWGCCFGVMFLNRNRGFVQMSRILAGGSNLKILLQLFRLPTRLLESGMRV